MTSRTRELFDAYISRRSRWGPPWWVYGVTFGALNLVRQGAIILSPADISTPVRIGSWAATVLVTLALINGIALAHRRLVRRRDRQSSPALQMTPPTIVPEEEAA